MLLLRKLDPEELKKQHGLEKGSDLYKDPKTGEVYVKPKGGAGPGEATGVILK